MEKKSLKFCRLYFMLHQEIEDVYSLKHSTLGRPNALTRKYGKYKGEQKNAHHVDAQL